jgi:DNA-binding transcriptional ArsR family regulator
MQMTMRAADRVFRALAAPPRRKVLDLLRDSERSVSELQASFRMSQPALSRHLKVLRDARLVKTRREGRAQVYRLNAEPLAEAMNWMLHYRAFWRQRFARLDALVAELEEE